MALATPADIGKLLQDADVDDDAAQLALDLVYAEMTTAAAVDDAEDLPDWSRSIALQAAIRLYVNPSSDQSESIDDYTRRYATAAQGGLLTDAERARVAASAAPTGAFTITPARIDPLTGTWYERP